MPRLYDILETASKHDVLVELVLFCFWYGDEHWESSPMHPDRNVQGLGPRDRHRVYAVSGNDLLPVQERFVRMVVEAVNEYDNVYFEICNEPYSRHDGTAYLDWQHYMVDVIADVESRSTASHLIAVNYQNRAYVIPEIHPAVSIANFHYALPQAVYANARLGRIIADDETGFRGQSAEPYRREAWRFFFAGGGMFSHLDYSFTCEHPDGSAPIVGTTPGYGGEDLRRQLAFLRRFLEDNEVWTLRSANEVFAQVAGELDGLARADHGRLYLFYLPASTPGRTVSVNLHPGTYRLEWVNPVTCRVTHAETINVASSFHRITTPPWEGDVAFRCART
jgi:hypothetical protein